MLRDTIERWVRSEKKGVMSTALATPPSLFFQGAVHLRNLCYDRHILNSERAAIKVVSVGNLVAGGTGKTSLVALMARRLGGTGSMGKLALISRGYRSLAEKGSTPKVVCYGRGPCVTSQEGGDEAYLLAHCLPETIVISGRNRVQAVELGRLLGARLALLDDGLQYRRLRRDCEIVLIDSTTSFGGGHFLPRGLLRDQPTRLKSADLIAVCGDRIPDELKKWAETAGDHPPIVRFERHVCSTGGDIESLPSFKGTKVALFSGIGNPASFYDMVRKQVGSEVVDALELADHRAIGSEELMLFAKRAAKKGASALLCTEKDWIKCAPYRQQLPLPIGYLQCELCIAEGERVWDGWIETMKGWLV